jgi:DIL domain
VKPSRTEGSSATDSSSGHVRRTATEIGKEFLGPLIQLLQWLQVLSSLGDEEETFRRTVEALNLLTPSQLLLAANQYRVEVGEHGLPKKFKEILRTMAQEKQEARRARITRQSSIVVTTPSSSPTTTNPQPLSPTPTTPPTLEDDDISPPPTVLIPSNTLLPFALPTTTEMITSYGAGIGGTQREKYTPTLPPEFIEKLDSVNSHGPRVPLGGVSKTWMDEDIDEEREIADRVAVQGGGGGWGQ